MRNLHTRKSTIQKIYYRWLKGGTHAATTNITPKKKTLKNKRDMIVHLNPKLGDGKGLLQFDSCQLNFPKHPTSLETLLGIHAQMRTRGVVVRERGWTPFRQIFWSQNGAPANIVGHRWNANTEAFRQITSVTARTRDLASKISKKNFSGWHPRTP